jgi:putative ATP-binding cassette transporter
MMEMLREELPDSAVVSIGHRPGLDRHHDRVLVLEASPEGAVLAVPEEDGGSGEAAERKAGRRSSEKGFLAGLRRTIARRSRRERPQDVAAK